MSSVWIIEQGEYSDYRVVGIYSTKEFAEKALAAISANSRDEPEIKERILDPAMDQINEGLHFYKVESYNTDIAIEDVEEDFTVEIDFVEPGEWCYYIWAKDKEHAIKIAAERQAKEKAIEAGIA